MPFTARARANGAPTSQTSFPNGSPLNPSLTFQGAANSGVYHPGSGNVAVSVNGTQKMLVHADGLVVTGNIVGNYVLGNGAYLTGVQTGLAGDGFAISNINAANLVGNIEADLNFDIGSVPGNALYGELDGDIVITGDIDANVLVGTLSNSILPTTLGTINTTYIGNGSLLSGLAAPMTISNVQITDSSWTLLDDTAVPLEGGYCLVNGSGFAPGSLVTVGTDFASSTSYISSTQLRAVVPAKSSGSYNLSVIRGDTAIATLALGITYSPTPVWGTSSTLANVFQNIAFTQTLSASSDSNVIYANTTALPPQTTLATNGTLSGNITSAVEDTTYSFTVNAIDAQLQDTPRTFLMSYTIAWNIGNLDKITLMGHSSFIIAGSSRYVAYGFGYNFYGQLGDGTTADKTTPTKITGGSLAGKFIDTIAHGENHTYALCTDGSLHAWGLNSSYQLGNGSTTNRSTPQQAYSSGVTAVACGSTHTIILTTYNQIYGWGYAYYGQLATTGYTEIQSNTTITNSGSLNGKTASAIACGWWTTLVLCTDASLHSFGYGTNGALGNGGTSQQNLPVDITNSGSLSGKTVSKISCGDSHVLVLCTDSSLHAFGRNLYGELGDGTTTQRNTPINITNNGSLSGKTVSKISAAGSHSIVVCTDSTLHGFGGNWNGQLGDGTTTQRTYPVNITNSGSLSGKTVSSVTTGAYHTLVRCSDGTLHSFGWNNYYQLGDGTTTTRNLPVNITTNVIA